MKDNNSIWRELLIVAVGEAVCVGLMLVVFALLGRLDQQAVLGGVIGGALALGNFALTAVVEAIASAKASQQDVKGAQGSMTLSMMLRYLLLLLVLVLTAKSGSVNVLALVLPLLFVRPLLTIGEFFRKKGDST